MSLKLTAYKDEHKDEVALFNGRMQKGGSHTRLPADPQLDWLPMKDNSNIEQVPFIAIDKTGQVRGGVILKRQDFLIDGTKINIASYKYPLSEGIINPKYSIVGVQILRQALKIQPRLFGLGMGSLNLPYAQVLKAARWFLVPVPFWYLVVDANKFLKNIYILQSTPIRSLFSNALRVTGIGKIALTVLRLWFKWKKTNPEISYETIDKFGDWTDKIWEEGKNLYNLLAVRNSDYLDRLYPEKETKFIRLKIVSKGKPVGWSILLNTSMNGHKYFGDMQVGTIVDCFSSPSFESDVISASRDYLVKHRANIIISNQSSDRWCYAMKNAGTISGPTNFFLALSPKLIDDLDCVNGGIGNFHINRADGDGPIHL
jgi:hypothetical protein